MTSAVPRFRPLSSVVCRLVLAEALLLLPVIDPDPEFIEWVEGLHALRWALNAFNDFNDRFCCTFIIPSFHYSIILICDTTLTT
jgi:hypothetical protein